MKKLLTVLMTTVAVALLFTGCGATPTSTTDSQSQPPSQANSQGGDRQSFRQNGPAADLNGEVDTISGNSITLKLIAMPVRPSGRPDATGPAGSPRPRGTGGLGFQGGNRPVQYTGKTETIALTDSIPITTMTRGANGAQQENIKISDIKKGDRIQVWYADKDKKTISKVSVSPPRANPSPSPATN